MLFLLPCFKAFLRLSLQLTFEVFMLDLSLLESLLDDALASETEDSLREWLSSIGSMS